MADVIRCSNGHFYDRSVYNTCPHCLSREEIRSTHQQQKLISRLAEQYLKEYMEAEAAAAGVETAEAEPRRQEVEILPVQEAGGRTGMTFENRSAYRQEEAEPNDRKEEAVQSVRREYPSVGMGHSHMGGEPAMATGWLVCLRGYYRGRSFTLGDGYNSIGRKEDNRICLPDDHQVPERQISVTYDIRGNQFYLVVFQNCRAALNGEVFYGSRLLKEGDLIQIGVEIFEFIPYCKGNRRWIRMPGESMDMFKLQDLKAEGGGHDE